MKVGGLRTIGPSTVRVPGGTCRTAAGNCHPPSRLYMPQSRRGFPSTASRLFYFKLVPSVRTSCRFWKIQPSAGRSRNTKYPYMARAGPSPRDGPARFGSYRRRLHDPVPTVRVACRASDSIAVTVITDLLFGSPSFFGRCVTRVLIHAQIAINIRLITNRERLSPTRGGISDAA
jgi:hypothetical protein